MAQSNETTIEQMNITLAAFEGRKFYGHTIDKFGGDTHNALPPMKYHTSWDWLMPVVEKVHSLKDYYSDGKHLRLMSKITVNMGMNGHYKNCSCSILGHITYCYTLSIPHDYKQIELPSIFVHDKNTLIEAVYESVYQFIQWYNQQKQNNDSKQQN